MTETTAAATTGENDKFDPAAQAIIDKQRSARTHALICYTLALLSCITGITGVIALIWAYIKRGDAIDTPMYGHFNNVISVFWVSFFMFIIGFITTIFFVGYLILAATLFWVLYRDIKGLIRAMDNKPFNS